MTIGKNITPFDVSQVNLALRAVVAETPAGTRYVNPDGKSPKGGRWDLVRCYYVDRENRASCLVGKAAERLGIPLPKWDSPQNRAGISDYTANSLRGFFTPRALDRLSTVQSRQDNGETWRRAIR